MTTHTAKQVYAALMQSTRIALVPHQRPDGDALGAATAASQWLEAAGKDVSIIASTGIDAHLNYLPHADRVVQDPLIWQIKQFDYVMVFDSGDLEYTGVAEQINQLAQRPIIINMDHHKSNTKFGDINLVQTTGASTTEILYTFFRINGVAINPNMATSLMTGLIADTDNFTNAATTEKSLAVGSHLVDLGANFNTIKAHIYKNTPLSLLKLWGDVFSRMTHHDKHDVVYSYVTQADMKKYNLRFDQIAGLSNFMNNLAEGKAGMLLYEQEPGKMKGSMRTTRDDVDLSRLATELGGGGHQKSAGFSLEASSAHEALETVFQTMERLIHAGELQLART